MSKIIVTGGAGFIGSHVCEALLSKGDNVICIDDFNDYYSPKIKRDNIDDCLRNPNFRLYEADIYDNGIISEIFRKNKIDVIIHLAARAGVRGSFLNPGLYQKVNVQGTLNLLNLAVEFKISKFIFGSSSSVYGANDKVPFSENDPVNNQISPYAITKKEAEDLCKRYSKDHNLKVACLRFFTVYGPRGRPDMAPYKFTKLIGEGKEIEVYGDGKSKRDYTHVQDIVDGILSALEKEFDFEIINIGDSRTIELNYLIRLIEENLGKKANIVIKPKQKGDVEITYADISKAKMLLSYSPKVSIEEGIKLFVEWFKKNENR
ncbi:MAG: GDP-mannose 4,6-dehydratase [Nanoarchaeota archaeon]|nr:GDP-mannose 4,6-dehydratase [Nanoarchaeota archaeon]